MTVTYKTFCETGLKRKINQDRVTAYSNKNISLFAVADGVGGHSMGEYASETAIKYLDALWNEISDFTGDIQTAVDMTVSALGKANTEVFRFAAEKKIICGSTASVLLICGNLFAVINVGDSPIYRADRKKAQCESTEHSYDAIVRKSMRTVPANSESNKNGRLVRAVGIADRLLPSVKTGRIIGNQVFLICSDGVSKYFSDKKIFGYLKNAAADKINISGLSEILKGTVYNMGAADNLSAVMVRACADKKLMKSFF